MRIGIDLGGTKIEGVMMDAESKIVQRLRVATPQNNYAETINSIREVVAKLELDTGIKNARVGIAHPGAISPASGLLKNANSVCLNGKPFKQDVESALQRTVRMANDADCLAVSEAVDGAAAGAKTVFAAILGTGVGGGIVIDGKLHQGKNAIAGEWGHNPLPWPRHEWGEIPGPKCWDGRYGSLEVWLSGVGMAQDHTRVTTDELLAEEIVQRAEQGDEKCSATLSRYEDRLARALATVINFIDPDVIVLGGGVSRVQRIYKTVPALWDQWVFSDSIDTQLKPAMHGDSSGVRGAAWLWPAR